MSGGYAGDCDEETDSEDHLDMGTGPDAEEKAHFLEVCYSFLEYGSDAFYDLERMQETIQKLDAQDMAMWKVPAVQWYTEIQKRVQVNLEFLRLMPNPEVCGADLGPSAWEMVATVPQGHRVASRNSSKVRSTLRQFVRDWAKEGQPERQASYQPLISALLKHLPPKRAQGAPAVLCPGCGLARLPFDLVRLGYAAQGNEFSYHMLLGTHLILNRSEKAECFNIFPFVLSLANRKGRWDHLRAVKIPDVCPMDALGPNAQLSMAAGEFVEVYKHQVGAWDGMATCFFLDTAKNMFLYIRTIADIIRKGGVWTNLGPLLYHYADVPTEVSVELSWEEVRPYICEYFDLVEEEEKIARYAGNTAGLSVNRYRCIFFVAIRNDKPTRGHSNPVF
ncbi:unnamed protein product [Effrenium voratum]|nr:unnamed protein product [Effrenium voratum]